LLLQLLKTLATVLLEVCSIDRLSFLMTGARLEQG